LTSLKQLELGGISEALGGGGTFPHLPPWSLLKYIPRNIIHITKQDCHITSSASKLSARATATKYKNRTADAITDT